MPKITTGTTAIAMPRRMPTQQMCRACSRCLAPMAWPASTAADLTKLAMLKVQHWLGSENSHRRLIIQVHDELVLEVPQTELYRVKEMLSELTCGVAELKMPLLVELGEGKNWDEAE